MRDRHRPVELREAHFPSSMLTRHRVSRDPTGSPRGLEVEATGDSIDVEHFTREIKSWHDPALHRFEIDLGQLHSTAGNKFIFVERLAFHSDVSAKQKSRQLVRVLTGK